MGAGFQPAASSKHVMEQVCNLWHGPRVCNLRQVMRGTLAFAALLAAAVFKTAVHAAGYKPALHDMLATCRGQDARPPVRTVQTLNT